MVELVYLLAFSGMITISFFWEFVAQLGHKLSCHLLSYLVIACTLVFLPQLLMLLQQIAGLQSFITQGRIFVCMSLFAIFPSECFNIFFSYRASPCEFVIPLAKYVKAVYHTRISVGMRFRMLFETEESSVRRYPKLSFSVFLTIYLNSSHQYTSTTNSLL
jgi:hypothetical protein